MDSAPPRTEGAERCLERERLLREWTRCGRRLAKLLDEHLAAVKRRKTNFTEFQEQIRLARTAEVEPCRKYYGHVNTHGCAFNG